MAAIDHLVLPVTTLGLARARLSTLGFTVAPDARHPFGTGNCCVFFENRTYLEPITILNRNAADLAASEGMFFVKRLKRFMERHGEGFAMLALKSDDAEAAQERFEKAGVSAGPLFRFSRKATLSDGSEREIGFVLAYANSPAAPDATIFACQHLDSDALFQPSYLTHPNGATGVVAVTAVAENPADFHILLSEASGQRELRATSLGVEAEIAGQALSFLTPAAFLTRYGVDPPDPRNGLRLAAFDLVVSDMERAAVFAGQAAKRHEERIVVPASPGLGAVLAFRSVGNG